MLLFDDFKLLHVLYLDINECESDVLNNCHENAQCTNTEGSFTCSCNPGYTGNGVNCTSKRPCLSGGMKRNITCVECMSCYYTTLAILEMVSPA